MRAVEFAKRIYNRRKKYFENSRKYSKIIKTRAKNIFGKDARIFVFGSLVRKDYHPMISDIDIAVVSKGIPERAAERAKTKLKLKKGFEFSPFEIHLLNHKEWQTYKKFIDAYSEVS